MKYKNILFSQKAHITTLRAVIGLMLLVILVMAWGWKNAPKQLVIHNPPDLRSGSTRAWWEIDPSNVYAFSFYIFQQLNSWPTDGDEDYLKNIYALQGYFTPACYDFFISDYEYRRALGELRGRSRGVSEIIGRGYHTSFRSAEGQTKARVELLGQDAWNVTFDLTVDEYFKGEAVKRTLVRYPLNVVRADINPEVNPWGLLINCYSGHPQRLVPASEKEGA